MVRVALTAVLAAVTAAAVASCLVDRRSGEYDCANDADCAHFTDNRVCDPSAKVCVPKPPDECPAQCTGGCSVQAKTCSVNCLQNQCSDKFTCPDGYNCTVQCVGTKACADIDCSKGASCGITCNGSRACGDIDCPDGKCQVACVGSNACGDVDCSSSCACTLTCNDPSQNGGACGHVSCPSSCTQGSGCGGCDTCSN